MTKTHKLCFFTLAILAALLSGCTSCDKSGEIRYNRPRNIRGVVSYHRSFGDLNDAHLQAARRIGIKPLAKRDEARALRRSLTPIAPSAFYQVDSLTHSIAYLVPQAADLLNKLALNFTDSVCSKGLNPYQLIVTSVLRTKEDVAQLNRCNRNSIPNSAHMYGTTFDVSYRRYFKVEDPRGPQLESVSPDTLKMVLSEVLRDLKKEGRCLVKYERKQGCFHITAR